MVADLFRHNFRIDFLDKGRIELPDFSYNASEVLCNVREVNLILY